MKLVRKGLFGSKNISATSAAQQMLPKENKDSYRGIINSFNFHETPRKLLFQYVTSLAYNIRTTVLRKQLALLQTLTLDDQIKILNKTLAQRWSSLLPAYELLVKTRFDNVQQLPTASDASLDVVEESF